MYVHVYIHCTKVLQNSHDWGEGNLFVEYIWIKEMCSHKKKKEYKILMFNMLLITEIISWKRESAL